ncbi:MAG: DUF1206 domain-containing protein [Chloroflexota bacterium]|nr:DUF1206 domain-containing protein [Chloroflexota bacterium]
MANSTIKKVQDGVAHAAGQTTASPWLEGLARFGYAVRGVLYGTVGLLALLVALGRGGAATDKSGAITVIGNQPFGKFLLLLVVVGLIGYAIWGFVRALLDPMGKGTDAKGLAQRAGYFVSGLSYGALVLPTVQLLLGNGGNNSGGGSDWTAKLLAAPFGPWLVGLIGLIGIGGGLGQMYLAWSNGFQKDFKQWEMAGDTLRWASWVARVGLVARGVIFMMLGFFLIQAARNVDPKQVVGIDGALAKLAHEPAGPWLLGLVALGLVAFGVYSLSCARWIRIRPAR